MSSMCKVGIDSDLLRLHAGFVWVCSGRRVGVSSMCKVGIDSDLLRLHAGFVWVGVQWATCGCE